MALGVAIARAMPQNVRRLAGDRVELEVGAVFDLVSHEFKAMLDQVVGGRALARQVMRFAGDVWVVEVDELAGGQI